MVDNLDLKAISKLKGCQPREMTRCDEIDTAADEVNGEVKMLLKDPILTHLKVGHDSRQRSQIACERDLCDSPFQLFPFSVTVEAIVTWVFLCTCCFSAVGIMQELGDLLS